jgi:hypothetical protein
MITKTAYTLMIMFTVDFTDPKSCAEHSLELYGVDRCYTSYNRYMKPPLPRPEGLEIRETNEPYHY